MSTFILKLIACITMLADHIGWFSFVGYPELGNVLRAFGRISFPIFCYLIAFGFRKTHNQYLYLLRLIIVGLISELPYNYCFHSELSFDFNNVYFTLALGLLSIIVYNFMLRFGRWLQRLALVPTVIFALIAALLGTDYGAYGVILIVLFYFAGNNKVWITVSCALFSCRKIIDVLLAQLLQAESIASVEISDWSMMQLFAVFAVVPILCCNGERGPQPKSKLGKAFIKYAFYFFYPIHLLVIGIIMRKFIM